MAEAAVVGCEDDDELVKPMAFVVPRPGRQPADAAAAAAFTVELQSWVKSRLAPYKYPRWVELLTELPEERPRQARPQVAAAPGRKLIRDPVETAPTKSEDGPR